MLFEGLEKMAGAGLTPLRKKIIDHAVRKASQGIKQLKNVPATQVPPNAFGALEFRISRALGIKRKLKDPQ